MNGRVRKIKIRMKERIIQRVIVKWMKNKEWGSEEEELNEGE